MTEQANLPQQIIAKCWADEAFKQRLLADPAGTLKQEGVEIPAGVSIKVVENTDTSFYWVIPPRPCDVPVAALEGIAGGGSTPCGPLPPYSDWMACGIGHPG